MYGIVKYAFLHGLWSEHKKLLLAAYQADIAIRAARATREKKPAPVFAMPVREMFNRKLDDAVARVVADMNALNGRVT